MTAGRYKSKSTVTWSSCSSLVLHGLLLLTTWQGPVPWCHCHGTLANSPGVASSLLAEHLRTHHCSLDPFANILLGWHLHLDIPGTAGEQPAEKVPPQPELLPVISPVDSVNSSIAQAAEQLCPAVELLACVSEGIAGRSCAISDHQQSHFFVTFASSLSLPERLCVSRS